MAVELLPSARVCLHERGRTSRGESDEETYVMCMDTAHSCSSNGSQLRTFCGLSSGVVSCIDSTPGRLVVISSGESTSRRPSVNDVCVLPDAMNIAMSCSTDGWIRLHDFRSSSRGSSSSVGWHVAGEELNAIASCDYGNEFVVACATENGHVHLLDRRGGSSSNGQGGGRDVAGACVASILEAHTEPIMDLESYQLSVCGVTKNVLMSAGVDGLICVFDITNGLDDNLNNGRLFREEERYLSVMNAQSSVSSAGCFGDESGHYLYALTHDYSLSIYDWNANICIGETRFAREDALAASASQSKGGGHSLVDYIICCAFDRMTKKLMLASGSSHGDISIFPVDFSESSWEEEEESMDVDDDDCCGGGPLSIMDTSLSFQAPAAQLRRGHESVVRCINFLPSNSSFYSESCYDGAESSMLFISGCEGGQVCLWENKPAIDDSGNHLKTVGGHYKQRRKHNKITRRPY